MLSSSPKVIPYSKEPTIRLAEASQCPQYNMSQSTKGQSPTHSPAPPTPRPTLLRLIRTKRLRNPLAPARPDRAPSRSEIVWRGVCGFKGRVFGMASEDGDFEGCEEEVESDSEVEGWWAGWAGRGRARRCWQGLLRARSARARATATARRPWGRDE